MSEAARPMARETYSRHDPAGEEFGRAEPQIETFPGENRPPQPPGAQVVAMERLVWQSRGLILRSARTGLLLSLGIAFLLPQRFQSTARLMPPDPGSSGAGLALMAGGGGNLGAQLGSGIGSVAGDLLGLKSSSELFIGILQSRTVEDDLISRFSLSGVYGDRLIEDAREDLARRTNLSLDRRSGILTIQVMDHDPRRAAAMAGEYASELDRVVTALNTSSAHRERVFLEDRLFQVRQDLESAETNFSEFATRNAALDIPTQGKAMIEAAATLEGQLITAQTQLQGLKQGYTDRNLRVRATQARVEELRAQLEKNLTGAPVATGRGDANRPDAHHKPAPENQLGTENGSDAANRSSLYPSIRELPALGIGYADLYRNTKIQEALYQTLTQEYELAKIQEAKETPRVKILDPPDVPGKRSSPPRRWIVMLGTLLSIVLSVTWAVARDAWDRAGRENRQKELAEEVLRDLRVHWAWALANGAGGFAGSGKFWRRFRRT
jgi:uncharacterized protein involved in exopolysaccharide biosynthesis